MSTTHSRHFKVYVHYTFTITFKAATHSQQGHKRNHMQYVRLGLSSFTFEANPAEVRILHSALDSALLPLAEGVPVGTVPQRLEALIHGFGRRHFLGNFNDPRLDGGVGCAQRCGVANTFEVVHHAPGSRQGVVQPFQGLDQRCPGGGGRARFNVRFEESKSGFKIVQNLRRV